ncbi:MAG: hypothetical protein DRJ15_12335 [Bacteroidetes bacterium]|nr:MAG: hypothetical protein DRJ15_12335 [Bacteroidota bacterium]
MKLRGPLSVRTLIIIMVTIVIIGVLVAKSYYGNTNKSIDPRILEARKLYEQYDVLARTGDYQGIFSLLDSIEGIYEDTDHYKNSFELGVIENNRAAALLTIALYRDSIPEFSFPFSELSDDSLVSVAEKHIRRAISLYEAWNASYSGKSSEELRSMTAAGFREGLEVYDPDQVSAFQETRIDEIEKSILENHRRLSVCYSNLGIVYRYQEEYKEAVMQYEKALELWDRNLDAENNLNKLLNHPIKKRNFIQKLFPPNRDIND